MVRRLTAGARWIRTLGPPATASFVVGPPYHSLLLVWGFSCQVVIFCFAAGSLFGAGRPFFVPSPAIRFAERAEGVKGPKRQQSLAACRVAWLVFRSAPCSSQGQALTPEHAER